MNDSETAPIGPNTSGMLVLLAPVPQKCHKALLALVVWASTSAGPMRVGTRPQHQDDPVQSHSMVSTNSELFWGREKGMGREELAGGRAELAWDQWWPPLLNPILVLGHMAVLKSTKYPAQAWGGPLPSQCTNPGEGGKCFLLLRILKWLQWLPSDEA